MRERPSCPSRFDPLLTRPPLPVPPARALAVSCLPSVIYRLARHTSCLSCGKSCSCGKPCCCGKLCCCGKPCFCGKPYSCDGSAYGSPQGNGSHAENRTLAVRKNPFCRIAMAAVRRTVLLRSVSVRFSARGRRPCGKPYSCGRSEYGFPHGGRGDAADRTPAFCFVAVSASVPTRPLCSGRGSGMTRRRRNLRPQSSVIRDVAADVDLASGT